MKGPVILNRGSTRHCIFCQADSHPSTGCPKKNKFYVPFFGYSRRQTLSSTAPIPTRRLPFSEYSHPPQQARHPQFAASSTDPLDAETKLPRMALMVGKA